MEMDASIKQPALSPDEIAALLTLLGGALLK